MRRVFPNPQDSDEPHGVLTAIAENIAVLEIRYFDGEEWDIEWPEEMMQLPELVEVNMATQKPGQKEMVKNSFVVSFGRWPAGRT